MYLQIQDFFLSCKHRSTILKIDKPMKTLRFFLCVSMTLVVLFCACDKSDEQLEHNSLSIAMQSEASGCLDKSKTKSVANPIANVITLEARGNTLMVYRKGEFNCGAKIQLSVSNEGNTITLKEENLTGIAYCGTCPMECICEIVGMKEGEYVISIQHYYSKEFYDPIVFSFKEGAEKTVDLGYNL